MWSRLCNLRMETRCPTLVSRIHGRLTKHAAKSLLSGRPSPLLPALRRNLNRQPEDPEPNGYGHNVVRAITECGQQQTLAALSTDSAHPQWTPRPPWVEENFKVATLTLPRPKQLCSTEEVSRAADHLFQQPSLASASQIFTDGSVDLTTGTAGAAIWSPTHQECWRVSSGSSSTQTELSAIRRALERGLSLHAPTIAIITDSTASIQAIRRRQPSHNIHLITSIQHLIKQHHDQGTTISLTWVPSHSGIKGNEQADSLAKQAHLLPNINEKIQPTVSQLTGPIAQYQSRLLHLQHESWVARGSPSAKWYKVATKLEPSPITTSTPRKLATTVTRLRLGHKCVREIFDAAPHPCDYCQETPDTALIHYLLHCTETASLRDNRAAIQDQPHPDDFTLAAATVYNIVDNLPHHLETLQTSPPPR